jgi:predicted DNA-binding transcriptional regulator AlpA
MEYVHAAQVAMMIGISERTVRRWIARGKLPARHLGPNRYVNTTSNIDMLVRTFKLAAEPPDDRDIHLAHLEVLERQLQTVSKRLTLLVSSLRYSIFFFRERYAYLFSLCKL